jgi:hypothetical protein
MQASAFLLAVLASMLEPFTLAGCVVAGSLLDRLWKSLIASTAWALVVQHWIIMPRVQLQEWSYTPDMLLAAILAAWLTTAIVYALANSKPRGK